MSNYAIADALMGIFSGTDDNHGLWATQCPGCGRWPYWGRLEPMGEKSSDGYRRLCPHCGEELQEDEE